MFRIYVIIVIDQSVDSSVDMVELENDAVTAIITHKDLNESS